MTPPAEARIERHRPPWCTGVTADAIRHFAWGIGDDNPLYLDPDHWRRSRWDGQIAPPCFAYAIDETTVAPGLDDRRRVYRSVDWVWFDALRVGDDIEPTAHLEHQTDGPEGLEQKGRVEFRAPTGELVAAADVRCCRPPDPAPAIDERPELRYSADEIDAIERAILDETRRGPLPRFWEDVTAGDELGSIIKGPLSIMDVVAWCAGTQGVATETDGYSDGGLHAETATGPQQVAWIAQLVTDWMGDDGFLHRLHVDVEANPPLGSTTTMTGRVTGLRSVGGDRVADLDLVAADQAGARTASAAATVLLPSREAGAVTVPVSSPIDLAR